MAEITQASEVDLQRRAEVEGPRSAAATILRRLAKKRAKDRQVFMWQLGQHYFVAPAADAEMEARIREIIRDDAEP